MKLKKQIKRITIIIVVFISTSCCSWMREFNDPPRPSKVRGWEEIRVGDTIIKGMFVLAKGDSTDNSKFGIRIVDIYPGECHLLSEPEYPRTKLQFYRVSDKSIVCEPILRAGSNDLRSICGKDFDWSIISINAINSKNNWVAFDLRKL